MSGYLTGILAAFGEPVVHAWANICDEYFCNRVLHHLTALIFFSQLANILFLPIIFLLSPPEFLPIHLLSILLLIALIEVLSSYPYYWSLRRADTSVVDSLFSLGKIFLPLLAFLIVGEHISNLKYAGFFVIILSSVALTLNFKKLQFNFVFFLMLFVSVLTSLQAVLFKYIFDQGVSWGSVVVWGTVLQFFIACLLLCIPANREEFITSSKKIMNLKGLFLLSQFFTWVGQSFASLALFFIPVSVAKGISSTQPIFTLIYAMIFRKNKPDFFQECLGTNGEICLDPGGGIWKKIPFFILIIAGTILISLG